MEHRNPGSPPPSGLHYRLQSSGCSESAKLRAMRARHKSGVLSGGLERKMPRPFQHIVDALMARNAKKPPTRSDDEDNDSDVDVDDDIDRPKKKRSRDQDDQDEETSESDGP